MTATQTPTSGVQTYVNYGFESTYGTGVSGTRTFGQGVKLSAWDNKNNFEKVFVLGQRNAATAIGKQYEGTASVEFVLSNASFFRAILGAVADSGSGPYTHTYTESTILPSLTITTGTVLGTADEVTTITGYKVSQAQITAAISELVKVRLDGTYQLFSTATTSPSSQVAETFDSYSFAEGTLQLPSGTTVANIQSFELTVKNSLENLYALGQRYIVQPIEKTREYDFKITTAFTTPAALLAYFAGTTAPYTVVNPTYPVGAATMVLTFSNGITATSTACRQIVATFDNIQIDQWSLPKSADEMVKEDVTGIALSCTSVVWTNNTSTDTGSP